MTNQEIKNRIAVLENKVSRMDKSLNEMWGKPEMVSRYMNVMKLAGEAEKEIESLKNSLNKNLK